VENLWKTPMAATAPYRRPILVALLHEMLNAEEFDTLGGAVAALKARAARLHVPYDAALITEALTAVQQTRPLVTETRPIRPAARVLPALELVPRDTARGLVGELYRRNPDAKTPW
jgi:hypothetical protein